MRHCLALRPPGFRARRAGADHETEPADAESTAAIHFGLDHSPFNAPSLSRMANSEPTPADLARMSIAEQYEWFKAATSRRSLLRGGLVSAGTIAAGATVLAGPAGAATGATSSSTATASSPSS